MKSIISGRVIRGDGFGRRLGFPTANLDRRRYVRLRQNVRQGVYAGRAELPNGKVYRAGVVIGPLDAAGRPKLEAHLIAFTGRLYGKKITVRLHKFLRPFRQYDDLSQLRRQIQRDIQLIKKMKLHE